MSAEPMAETELAEQYAKGIDAGYAKMVKRVGKDEADKWRVNSIAAARIQAANYAAERARAFRL